MIDFSHFCPFLSYFSSSSSSAETFLPTKYSSFFYIFFVSVTHWVKMNTDGGHLLKREQLISGYTTEESDTLPLTIIHSQ